MTICIYCYDLRYNHLSNKRDNSHLKTWFPSTKYAGYYSEWLYAMLERKYILQWLLIIIYLWDKQLCISVNKLFQIEISLDDNKDFSYDDPLAGQQWI